MRLVRRASMVFSLILIVSISVGYVARTSALASERDQNLTAAADLGAERLTGLVAAARAAAMSADEPEPATDAVIAIDTAVGVCAVDATERICAGGGPAPAEADVERAVLRRSNVEDAVIVRTWLTVYDSLMTIEVDGPLVTLLVGARTDVVAGGTGPSIEVTTLLPTGISASDFSEASGLRQTSSSVDAAAGVFVVATGSAGVSLPTEEYRFYFIVFSLAVLLLLLASVTLFAEQRNLEERASFDSLTKLPNRGEFERRAAEVIAVAERNETGVCFLLLDLNGFKAVNDSYGHTAGDQMLMIVGSRLRKAVRDGDVVARWGGDEFVVAMPGIDSEEMGLRRGEQLAEKIGGRTRLDGVDDALRVKLSVNASFVGSPASVHLTAG